MKQIVRRYPNTAVLLAVGLALIAIWLIPLWLSFVALLVGAITLDRKGL